MAIAIHDTLYFDKIERTNKLQTLVAIAYASVNIKEKKEVIKQLEYALNIFKTPKSSTELGSGTYEGKQAQWSSKYTLSRDFGLVQESKNEIILSDFGMKIVKGEITPKYFISTVVLNYIQVVNNSIIHPLNSIICEMEKKGVMELSKSELKLISDFNLNGRDENNYVGGLIDILQATYFFEGNDNSKLKINEDLFSVSSLKNLINYTFTELTVEVVKEKFGAKNQKEWCNYLAIENPLLNKIILKVQDDDEVKVKVKGDINLLQNRLIYGAPGTGKSNILDKERKRLGGGYERVTFYEDYSYSQFVGTYKPQMNENGEIVYKYVPGPFLRQLANALDPINKGEPQLLIIEEINRANAAAVFGDMFQLLDRDSSGKGEYEIHLSEDIKNYFKYDRKIDIKSLRLPSNFYIWATMNCADQGVFPLDSAFKRRFDEYKLMDINENEREINSITIDIRCNCIGKVNWNVFRHTLNEYLLEQGIKDDKLIGPFFIKPMILKDEEKVQGAFKDKLLMYLLEDVVKRNRGLFSNDAKSLNKINSMYNKNDGKNLIFSEDFMDKLNEKLQKNNYGEE